MSKIGESNPEPGINRTSSTDDELNEVGKDNAQQARKASGTSNTDSTTGSTSGDSTEVVPSKTGDVKTRDQRESNWFDKMLNGAKKLVSSEPTEATSGSESADRWTALFKAGNYDAILEAAMDGNQSAKDWLKDNGLSLQRALQFESMTFQTMSNVSRLMHDMTMASIRNIKA